MAQVSVHGIASSTLAEEAAVCVHALAVLGALGATSTLVDIWEGERKAASATCATTTAQHYYAHCTPSLSSTDCQL